MFRNLMICALVITTLLSAKNTTENKDTGIDSSKNETALDQLNYYELNIRHFTKSGSIKSVIEHLPRLKEMGIDVLCILPIYPIGKTQREGSLGDPYFVQDYTKINHELGTKKDFKTLVEEAHYLEMKVIIDWDGHKISKDNNWSKKNWFKQSNDTKFAFPNYENDDLCDAMRDAMLSWVENYDVDGFRCFGTNEIPLWYWEDTWKILNKEKPMIALATSEDKILLENGFNILYASGLYEIIKELAKGTKDGRDVENYIKTHAGNVASGAHYINYISNQHENTNNGALRDRIGNSTKMLTIMTMLLDGNPMVFNGQEAGMSKSLKCCDKDEIPWYSYIRKDLFTKLLQLRHQNEAMHEGLSGGKFTRIQCTDNGGVLAFQRTKGKHRVVVMINMSDRRRLFKFTEQLSTDLPMYDLFTGEKSDLSEWNGKYKDLNIWEYRVYTTK